MQAGPFAASLHNHSPSLVTGASTRTLEVVAPSAAAAISGAARRQTVARNFARFGYAIIPLDLARDHRV